MPSLKINIAWALLGNSGFSLLQWLQLSLIAKFFGLEALGVYALAVAIVGPIFSFTNLHLRSVQATDVAGDFSFPDYFSTRLCFSSLAGAAVFLIVTLFQEQAFWPILSVALAKYIESFSDVIYGRLQRAERMKTIGVSMIFRASLSLSLFVALGLIWQDFEIALIALPAGNLLALWIVDRPSILGQESYRFRLNDRIISLIKTAWPLGIVIAANTLVTNVPRYIVDYYFDSKTLGVFAALSYFIVAGSMVVNALGQSALPRLANFRYSGGSDKSSLLLRLQALVFVVGLLGVLVAYVFGEYLLRVFYTIEVAKYHKSFVWLMVAAIPLYLSGITNTGVTSYRKFGFNSVISLSTLFVASVSGLLFIPRLGIEGAIICLAISYTFKWIVSMAALKKLESTSSIGKVINK